jgi:prophage antirepressor-like protein
VNVPPRRERAFTNYCTQISVSEVRKGPDLNVDFEIIDHNGERWVTVKELATALGYQRLDELRRLLNRDKPEFANKISNVKLTSLALQENLIINYHGVIRAAMLSNAPPCRRVPRLGRGNVQHN